MGKLFLVVDQKRLWQTFWCWLAAPTLGAFMSVYHMTTTTDLMSVFLGLCSFAMSAGATLSIAWAGILFRESERSNFKRAVFQRLTWKWTLLPSSAIALGMSIWLFSSHEQVRLFGSAVTVSSATGVASVLYFRWLVSRLLTHVKARHSRY